MENFISFGSTTISLFIMKMFVLYDSRSKSAVEKGSKTMYLQSISMRLPGERRIIRYLLTEVIEDKVMLFESIFTFGQSVIDSSVLL